MSGSINSDASMTSVERGSGIAMMFLAASSASDDTPSLSDGRSATSDIEPPTPEPTLSFHALSPDDFLNAPDEAGAAARASTTRGQWLSEMSLALHDAMNRQSLSPGSAIIESHDESASSQIVADTAAPWSPLDALRSKSSSSQSDRIQEIGGELPFDTAYQAVDFSAEEADLFAGFGAWAFENEPTRHDYPTTIVL